MKKMRKILSLALAVIMMMAMSITAFADNETTTTSTNSTITVSNLQVGSTVQVYKLATVVNNEIKVEKWAEDAYDISTKTEKVNGVDVVIPTYEMDADEVKDIEDAFDAAMDSTSKPVLVAENPNATATVNFTVEPGVYYIKATGIETKDNDGKVTEKAMIYKPMVAVAVEANTAGKYVAKTIEVVAKGTPDDINKVLDPNDDSFVRNGQVLKFEITKQVPRNVDKFVVYDYALNLTNLTIDSVTVGTEDITSKYNAFTADTTRTYTDEDNKAYDVYKIDFTNLVYANDAFVHTYENKTLTIKYHATVTGNEGFKNTGDFSVKDDDEKHTTPPVVGWTGDITLTKLVQGTQNRLNGAKFELKRVNSDGTLGNALTFRQLTNGDYIYDEAATTTELVTAGTGENAGIIKVTGLDEGTYQFVEIEAPTGYSINTQIAPKTITAAQAHQHETITVEDPSLSSLPFTGGMGTTIFTVLGVAIMAIAAALFFASKRKASK